MLSNPSSSQVSPLPSCPLEVVSACPPRVPVSGPSASLPASFGASTESCLVLVTGSDAFDSEIGSLCGGGSLVSGHALLGKGDSLVVCSDSVIGSRGVWCPTGEQVLCDVRSVSSPFCEVSGMNVCDHGLSVAVGEELVCTVGGCFGRFRCCHGTRCCFIYWFWEVCECYGSE